MVQVANPKPGGQLDFFPVSYTHLDVYKRQGFAISLEEIAMPDPNFATTLTRTRFRRPVLEDAVCNAKAGCLYPNNARMLVEAQSKGFGNALVADALGNLAESATANVFLVKDGVVFTPCLLDASRCV